MLRLEILRLGRTIVKTAICRASVVKFKHPKCMCRLLSTDSASKTVDLTNTTKATVSGSDDKEAVSNILAATEFGLDLQFINDVKNLWDTSQDFDSDFVLILKNCKTLVEFGFINSEIVEIMKKCPQLFLKETDHINEALYSWSKWTVGDDLLLKFLLTNPSLIYKGLLDLGTKIRNIKPYVENDRNVCKLFVNCPTTMNENWSTLKSKLDYIHSHNIPMKFVAQCSAMDFSLREIKTRFTFLERAGLYKQRIDLYKKDSNILNPFLSNILCPDDKEFAEDVAGLTLIEYEAFVDIYNAEMDDIENLIGSDGNDSE